MKKFEVILKNNGQTGYRLLTLLITLLHLIYFAVAGLKNYTPEAAVALLCILIFFIVRLINSKRKDISFHLSEDVYLLLAILWALNQNYLLMLLCFILMAISFYANSDIIFYFSDEAVVKKQFFKKRYDWTDFQNVVLKDTILTIDFKNNKLLQAEVKNESFINEIEFNSFVTNILNKHKSTSN